MVKSEKRSRKKVALHPLSEKLSLSQVIGDVLGWQFLPVGLTAGSNELPWQRQLRHAGKQAFSRVDSHPGALCD